MKYLKLVLPAMLLALSASVSATTYTFGNLTSDDTTNFIKDTVTGREYLRFDTFDLTYAQTVTAVGTGGLFEDWSIATSDIADNFYSAILGVNTTPCTGGDSSTTACGTLSGWSEGAFGNSHTGGIDLFWYLSTSGNQDVGYGFILSSGAVNDLNEWSNFANSDLNPNIDFLVYRDVSPVPVPAAAWLFGSALLGFFGFSRRKANA